MTQIENVIKYSAILLSVKWKYKIHITLTFICDYSNDLHETNIV